MFSPVESAGSVLEHLTLVLRAPRSFRTARRAWTSPGKLPFVQSTWWTECDVTSWPVVSKESRGNREKDWIERPTDGSQWLRKQPRLSRPSETAIEVLMLRLANLAGVGAPEAHACIWTTESGIRRGIAVRLFLDRQTEELSLGAELLRSHDANYNPVAKWGQTVTRVRRALEQATASDAVSPLFIGFAHMVAFDAWIGNGDRHQENWGVIRAGSSVRLAPMFDPAACLGTELLDGHRLFRGGSSDKDVQEYVEKCPSGFGDGASGLTLASVVAEIRSWAEWRGNIDEWIAIFADRTDAFLSDLMEVPEHWLPAHRKQLAARLLRMRLEWLHKNK